jgi:hypothetical protein
MTTDVTALCTRYKEALEMIAKGGENPIELALLAYAALYNQPPVETAVEERINGLMAQNERLRAALAPLLDEFGARLSDGKPLGYTICSMNRALSMAEAASAALAD